MRAKVLPKDLRSADSLLALVGLIAADCDGVANDSMGRAGLRLGQPEVSGEGTRESDAECLHRLRDLGDPEA